MHKIIEMENDSNLSTIKKLVRDIKELKDQKVRMKDIIKEQSQRNGKLMKLHQKMQKTHKVCQIRSNVISYDIRPPPKKQEVRNEDQSILQENKLQIKFLLTQNKVL